MAGENAIAAIVSMALTYCRRHERHEVDAAIRMWSAMFADTEAEVLRAAVIRWAETLDEDTIRAQVLPLPQTLKRIMGEGREQVEEVPVERPWTPVRPEFAQAHREARRRIIAISGGIGLSLEDALRAEPKARPSIKHVHQPPSYSTDGELITLGNEECRACNANELEERDRLERQAKVNAILAGLPEPVEDENDRRNLWPCRCGPPGRDGRPPGWIDTKASKATMMGEGQVREVYPCPQCNADLFGRWQRNEMHKAKEPTR